MRKLIEFACFCFANCVNQLHILCVYELWKLNNLCITPNKHTVQYALVEVLKEWRIGTESIAASMFGQWVLMKGVVFTFYQPLPQTPVLLSPRQKGWRKRPQSNVWVYNLFEPRDPFDTPIKYMATWNVWIWIGTSYYTWHQRKGIWILFIPSFIYSQV